MCDVENCKVKNPTYNFPEQKKGARCKKHAEVGMIDVKNKKCDYIANNIKCTKQPSYGFPGEKTRRCSEHSEEGMISLRSGKCDFFDEKKKCLKVANFGYPDTKPNKCSEHKLPNMIDLRHKKCEFFDSEKNKKCSTRASYGFFGEPPKRCKKHALTEMENIVTKQCEIKECKILGTFGFPEQSPKRCKEHLILGMIDVKHSKCIFPNCATRPTFNYPGYNLALYCKKHSLTDMIDVLNNKCEVTGCQHQPSFNFETEKTSIRCKTHKLDGMICLFQRCKFENCSKRANFNYEKETKGIYCYEHKKDGMSDVTHKKCNKCTKRANYNFTGLPPITCLNHKEEGMVCVTEKKCETCLINKASFGPLFKTKKHCYEHKLTNEYRKNNPICSEDDCLEKAFYTNDKSNYPIRCENHKLVDGFNIIEKNCKNCNLLYFLNEETGLCDICNEFVINKIQKVKETQVLNFLKTNGIIFISEDKIPEGACSKYRPDAVIDYKYFIVIIEIDEHQHKYYLKNCETTRMIQLHQDYGGIPVLFIRYNPDIYYIKNENGKKEKIKPSNKRLNILLNFLKTLDNLKNEYEKNVGNKLSSLSVCYLFYNNFDGKIKIEDIDIFEQVKILNKE
jgi:hypothetical protein